MRNARPDAQPADSAAAARRNDSSPELLPSGHQSRLPIPRDWRMNVNRRRSESSASSGSGKKDQQQQSHLERDGEWFGDARDAALLMSEKHSEQDSPAMSLLCSITKASANAVPEFCSQPLPLGDTAKQSRLRQPRPRFASSSGVGGDGVRSRSEGGLPSSPEEFYRLPWYRRPLPSNRRTGVISTDMELQRRNSQVPAPRAGSKPPRASTDGGGADPSVTSRGPTHATTGETTRIPELHQPKQERQRVQVPGYFAATESTSEPPPAVTRVRSTFLAFEAADGGPTAQQAVSKMVSPEITESRLAAEVDAIPAANSMAGDRDYIIPEEGSANRSSDDGAAAVAELNGSPPHEEEEQQQQLHPRTGESGSHFFATPMRSSNPIFEVMTGRESAAQQADSKGVSPVGSRTEPRDNVTPAANSTAEDRNAIILEAGSAKLSRGDSVSAAAELSGSPPEEKGAHSDEVKALRAEVGRLKREMASMAAIAATTATTTPTQQPGGGGGRRPSPRRSPLSLAASPTHNSHSNWQWGSTSVDCGETSDAVGPGRPPSIRLRADNSWMQRRQGSGSGDRGQHVRRNSSGGLPISNGIGLGGRPRAGSVLPIPVRDSNDERGKAPSDDGGEDAALLSPPAHAPKAEGPSPASGGNKAAAEDPGRRSSGVGSSDGAVTRASGADGGADSEGSRIYDAMRQASAFFPVQPAPASKAYSSEKAAALAALAAAVAARIGEAECPPEVVRVARAASDAVSEWQHQLDSSRRVATAPVVCAKIPVEAAGRGRGTCRRGAGDANWRVWRWVLAQRTRNQTVQQAVMIHGLPQFGRRHIWAAWAAVVTPETYNRPKASSDPSKEGSILSTIVHDVARTKIVHPLFGSGGQGMAMLKRVLALCAELGAVKEARYIQGMNYLAGFIMITLTDCVLSERDSLPPHSSRHKSTSGGKGANSSTASADSSTASEVTRRPGVQSRSAKPESIVATSDVKEGAAGEEEKDVAVKGPTTAELAMIESECVQMLQGVIVLQGGVLSRDLWGLHANTELVEDLLTKHCPDIMDHLRKVNLELIVLTPRWFICIYAGSIASQPVVTRIWDLFMWYGRRGPAVLVWVALALLHGCRHRMFESQGLPATVKAVRRHAEGCKTFEDLVRQAPMGLNQVVDAWEEQGNNRRIAALDGEGAVPDRMAAGLVGEMTGEPVYEPPPEVLSPPTHHRRSDLAPVATTSTAFGIQFPSTPGRTPAPLISPRSPFPEWAANIFRSSTGGAPFENGVSASVDGGTLGEGGGEGGGDSLPPMSPRLSNHSRPRQYRRAASTSWW